MTLTSLFHIAYIIFHRPGTAAREGPVAAPERPEGGLERGEQLGLSKEKPWFGRFVCAKRPNTGRSCGAPRDDLTGILLWFDNTFIGLLTKLGYDVSRTIHFYEAWLATLAIGVWHLFRDLPTPTSTR